VATPGGRIRDFSQEPGGYRYTEALNTPVQGGAAEIMLHALTLLDDALEPAEARLVNCIHDELVLEVPEESAERITPILEQVMCEGFLQMFPSAAAMTADLVEARTGRNWQEAK
jgi:DNA polymerase I-like protein with 3'-5' exonuclease and polymerase domains